MQIKESFHLYTKRLGTVYRESEALQITRMVFEKITGRSRLDIVTTPGHALTSEEEQTLEKALSQLLQHRPVQYVLEEAWFLDFPLRVTEGVLIPRPETEELVTWMLEDLNMVGATPPRNEDTRTLLDVGTGSGCIAIAIKKKIPSARVIALDKSARALVVARENARRNGVALEFLKADILAQGPIRELPIPDVIISNPPYIPEGEKSSMQRQVTEYEPAEALFVPDRDPLCFYRALLTLASAAFNHRGVLYVEVHEDLGAQTAALFREGGAREVLLRRDMNGRNRMIRARFFGESDLP